MPNYIVTSPDGKKFRVTAPEGATQEQILAYAQSQFSQAPRVNEASPPSRGVMEELGRQAGLAGRYAVEGISSIPAMVAQPLADLADMGLEAAGSDFRFGNQAANLSGLLTNAGLPQSQGETEELIAAPSRALASGGGLLSVAQRVIGPVAAALSKLPGQQAAGAVATALAAESDEQGGASEAML